MLQIAGVVKPEVLKLAASKIAITIENNLLKQIDILIKSGYFPNRSKAIREAVVKKLMRLTPCSHFKPERFQ